MLPQLDSPETLRHCLDVIRPALLLGPRDFLGDVRARLEEHGVPEAVSAHDTPTIFDWIASLVGRQGISNAAAEGYANQHSSPRWAKIDATLAATPTCPKLRSHWHFDACGYRKSAGACARPDHLPWCPVPRVAGRKGLLSEAAFGLRLFFRDIAGNNIVAWIDQRLADADPGAHAPDRVARMAAAIVEPFTNLPGFGPKVTSMILAELLLGGDPGRERWVTTGASMIAVDSLVHAFLHRTGILRRLNADHRYGSACSATGGCVDVITALSRHINARDFGADYPRCFPRWIQYAIWSFASAGGWSICHGNRIDDRERCRQRYCPAFAMCDRVEYKPV